MKPVKRAHSWVSQGWKQRASGKQSSCAQGQGGGTGRTGSLQAEPKGAGTLAGCEGGSGRRRGGSPAGAACCCEGGSGPGPCSVGSAVHVVRPTLGSSLSTFLWGARAA